MLVWNSSFFEVTSLSNNNATVVIGSGPNGLAAAIALARQGAKVEVFEAAENIGGAVRSAELTLPGFMHDVCSSVYPMAAGSPFFRSLPLQEHGLEWAHPEIPLAHPLDGGKAAVLYRSVGETAEGLGVDGPAYRRLMKPLADRWDDLAEEILGPMLHVPRHPILLGRFGLNALKPASWFVRGAFRGDSAKALFAGLAAHSFLPLDAPSSSAIGLVLGAAGHAVGWPFAWGGARNLSAALGRYLEKIGGVIHTGVEVRDVRSIGEKTALFFDTSPRQVLDICGKVLPISYAKSCRVSVWSGRFQDRVRARWRRFPGPPKSAGKPGPFMWAARSRRSASLKRAWHMARIRITRLCSWAARNCRFNSRA